MVIYHSSQFLSCHTRLKEFLDRMGGFHRTLTWMLSDIEAFSFPMSYQADTQSILSGIELESLSDAFPHGQIIWGVLSGFQLRADEIDLDVFPVSEHPQIWTADYRIQHPQAVCEIVAWDSSATFFRSIIADQMSGFSAAFPDAMTLTDFQNKKS